MTSGEEASTPFQKDTAKCVQTTYRRNVMAANRRQPALHKIVAETQPRTCWDHLAIARRIDVLRIARQRRRAEVDELEARVRA